MILTTYPRFIGSLIEIPPTQDQRIEGLEIAQGLRATQKISSDPTRTIDCPEEIKLGIFLDLGARPIASDLCYRVEEVAKRSLQQYYDGFSLLEMLRVRRPDLFLDTRVHYQTNYQFLSEIFGQPSPLNESRSFSDTVDNLHYAIAPHLT